LVFKVYSKVISILFLRFENTPYVVDVFEDTPIGSTVLMLFATDLDHGKNAKISYRLSSTSDKFSVERESGALVVSGTLDRESVPTYILTVIAEDGGISPLADQTEVEISVVDVNDNSPRFSNTIYQVLNSLILSSFFSHQNYRLSTIKKLLLRIPSKLSYFIFLKQGSVNENSPAGTSILEVSATDDDGGENGKVYYR